MAGTWGVEGTTATYKNEAGKVVAKITGLKSGVTATTVTNQIRVTEGEGGATGTLTLNSAVLGTDTKTPVKLTLNNGGKYVLALDEDTVSGVSVTDIALDYSVSKKVGKATVKGTLTAGYTLSSDAKSVTYSAAAEGQVLATVSNLSGDLTLSEGKLVREVTTTDDTTDEETTTTETAVTLVGDKVTLTNYALNGATVKLAKGKVDTYTLAISGVTAPVTTEETWSYKSGKATLKGTVEEPGYTLSVDGKTLTYTATGTNKTLATVSGLKSTTENLGLAVGTTVDANNNLTITVPANALNQTNVTVSGAGYLLALDDDAVTDSKATNENIWAVKDKTSAIYKTIKPEHYDYDATKNTIVYTKQADVKTLATVKNLKSGIKAENNEIEGIELEGNTITLSADVLNKKNVSLTNGTDESYKLALSGVGAPSTDPSTLKWSVSGTTATLKGNVTEGYTETSDTAITYVKSANNATLATVKGIVKNLKASTDGDYISTTKDDSTTTALSLDGTAITLTDSALTSSNVTLTNGAGSYKLELDEDVSQDAKPKTFWETAVENGKFKAKLFKGTDKYYTLDETTGTTITYKPADTGTKVATVFGLNENIKPDDDGQIDGIAVGKIVESEFVQDDTGTEIMFSANVLNQASVEVTNEGANKYTLNVPADLVSATPTTGWLTGDDSDAAILYNYQSEYYTGNGGIKLTYTGKQQGSQITKITGVKSGLKVNSDGTIDGITIGEYDDTTGEIETGTENTIYIGPKILDKKDVTITNAKGYEYKLGVTDDVKESTMNGTWSISSRKPVYTLKTTEGYKANDESGNIEYLSTATVKTTLSGLKTDLTASEGAIEGLAVGNIIDGTFTSSATGNVIQISSDVLNEKNVTLSTSGNGDYTFDLDDVTAYETEGDLVWESNEKGTAELKGIIKTGGYQVSGDGKTVAYMPKSDDTVETGDYKTLAKITGLASGLTDDDLAEGTSQTGSVITLSNDVLGTSKVSVTGGVYTLALDDDVPTKDDETSWKNKTEWVTSGTTATYKTHNAGYFTPSANGTTLNYTKETAGTTHATITGLASGTKITTTDTTITLTPDMLTNKSVTLTNKTGYSFKLALDGSVPTSTNASLWKGVTEWVTSGTTATYKVYNKAHYTINSSGTSVGYTKESTPIQTFATVSGIAKGVDITDCFTKTGDESGIITLGLDQLAGKKVTLKNVGNTEFVLALSEDIPEYDKELIDEDPEDSTKTIDNNPNSVRAISLGNSWTKKSNTAANYVETTSKGYSLSSDAKTINYATKSANTTLATLSGLTKNFDVSNLEGITVTAPTASTAGTIALTSDAIGESKKLTLGKKDNYVFAFDPDSTDVKESTVTETGWEIKKSKGKATGVVTYQTTPEEGYNISTDGKTFTAADTSKATVLATISGLNKDALADMEDSAVGEFITVSETVDSTDNKYTLTISNPALLTKKVTLGKKDNYKFALDNTTTDEDEAEDGDKILVSSTFTTPKWYVKSGTATYKIGTTEGYKVSSDGMTISYASEAAGDTVLTISGLNKNVIASSDHSDIGVNEKVPDSETGITSTQFSGDGITVTDEFNKVALTSKVLGTKTVTLTNGEGKTYKFSDGGFEKSTTTALEWSVSNGTATYSSNTSKGFILEDDGTTLTYTNAKVNTAATVTGLKKDWSGDTDYAINTNGTDIVINAALLTNSNVTLKIPKGGTAYSLSLATDVPTATNLTDSWKNQTEWVTSGTTATYKTYDKAYYTINSATSVKYNKPTSCTTHVTVSGIKKDVDITDCVDESTGVVTLGKDQLNKKTVSLANKEGYSYTLALKTDEEEVKEHVVQDEATWVEKTSKGKTTATLTGTLPAGYTVSDTKLTYAKASTQALATIAGISTGALDDKTVTLSAISNTIELDSEVGDNVTIDGKSTYAFNLANDYEGTITGAATADTITARLDSSSAVINSGKGNDVITITNGTANTGDGNDTINAVAYEAGHSGDIIVLGGAGADVINITGGNVTVTGGAGPDTITSGGGGANIFCYGDSDGADVIVNFAVDTDYLQVTSKTTPTCLPSGSDAVVKVKNSTITLTGLASAIDDINIYNKDGYIIHGKDFADEGSANVLLADDNYSTDAAQLSSIVEPFKATYTPYDFDTTLSLTKEENFTPEITYSKDNK